MAASTVLFLQFKIITHVNTLPIEGYCYTIWDSSRYGLEIFFERAFCKQLYQKIYTISCCSYLFYHNIGTNKFVLATHPLRTCQMMTAFQMIIWPHTSADLSFD